MYDFLHSLKVVAHAGRTYPKKAGHPLIGVPCLFYAAHPAHVNKNPVKRTAIPIHPGCGVV